MKKSNTTNTIWALIGALFVFLLMVMWLSNAGAAQNDALQFNPIVAVEKLAFVVGMILPLPIAILLSVGLILLPSYFMYRFIKRQFKNYSKENDPVQPKTHPERE